MLEKISVFDVFKISISFFIVNPTPTFPSIIWIGSGCGVWVTTNLANVTSARVWSSANPSVATVSNAVALTSLSAGTSLINYTATISVYGWG